MVVNILEDITQALAADVLTSVADNTDDNITVNIMSRGGDVMAGSAIIDALKISPAKVTTKVYGIAASMASAISQAGDKRLIAEDAIFQPHNSAALPAGRPTKERLQEAVDYLHVVDDVLVKSYSKSNLNKSELQELLKQDKPLTADKAIKMEFFDGKLEPVQAAANLNQLIMAKDQTFTERVKSLMNTFVPTAAEEVMAAPVDEAAVVAPAEEVAPVTPERDLAADIDALMKIVEELGAMIAQMQATPAVEEVVEAKLREVQSNEVMPEASQPQIPQEETVAEDVNVLIARQKEIQSKFNK